MTSVAYLRPFDTFAAMRKLSYIKYVACLMCLTIFLTKVDAQLSMQQDAVVVADSRIASPKTESGKATIIITAEELAATPASSVDEALRLYAGLSVNGRGGFGVQSDVGIRGSTFSQVLWLLDGMRLNDPLTSHFNSYLPITTEEIHHIEVIKGPGALSFGPDAVGGVIHIFSKAYMRDIDQDLSLHLGGGSHSYLLGEGAIAASNGKNALTISARHQSSPGEEFTNPNRSFVATAPPTYNTDFSTTTVSASAQHQLSDSIRIFSRFGYDTRDFGAKYFYTTSNLDESQEQTNSLWGHVSIEKTGVLQSRAFNVSYRRTDDVFAFNPELPANDHTTELIQANYDYGFRLNDRLSFATGAQYFYRGIESTDRGNHDNFNLAGYSMAKGYKDQWYYTAGLRFEYFSGSGSYQAVPQATLSYIDERFKIRALVGRAYRAPDFTENFVSFNIPSLSSGRNLGNPELNPESSWTFDLGLDYYINQNTKWESSVFLRTSTSLIDFVNTPASDIRRRDNLQQGGTYLYATNISAADTYGAETSLSGGWQWTDHVSLRSHLNLTYLFTEVADDTQSKYVSNHPNLVSNLMLQLQVGNVDFTSTSSYISRQAESLSSIEANIPAEYFLQHFRIGYTKGDWSIYGEARNLLDMDYQEILGAQMPGRWLVVGLRFNLMQL